jgi:hypothetical protein
MFFLAFGASCRWIGERFMSNRTACDFLIPHGFVGWVAVTYGVSTAPPLPKRNGRWVVQFPASGRLDTSTPFEEGTAADRYFYYTTKVETEIQVTAWKEGGLVWGGYTQCNGATRRCLQAEFIGTESEFGQPRNSPPPSLPAVPVVVGN